MDVPDLYLQKKGCIIDRYETKALDKSNYQIGFFYPNDKYVYKKPVFSTA